MEMLWLLFAMLVVAESPKFLFPKDPMEPSSHVLMTQGEFREGFRVWTRQCGWYFLVLVGFGAYFPEQWRLGVVYLGMLVVMWLGWAALCAAGWAPKK
ncbi:MAG: hypothetical protein CBB81_02695 [Cellvibrionales bacterium TMED21]|jgi:nitric oxide reductase large subunit|nr:hypothetical protein [Halieaceae bacterium]OUT66912.1 MAG: hypothetical protein CBB81_02695 [Cellvibrionales bacterium TMED21]|tara:strand:- start:3776 stop:4069 length:294 start_codon:yes stop_codon:yes gene_type:complete